MKKYLILILSLWMVRGDAQIDLSARTNKFYYTQDDPTYMEQSKGFQLLLPQMDLSFYNSSFTLEDIIVSEGDKNLLSLGQVEDQIRENNTILTRGSLRTLGLMWHTGDVTIGAGHNGRWIGGLQFTEDFASMINYGNAFLIGEPSAIGTDQDYLYYNEFYLSGAMDINGWVIGARVKLLSGQEFLETPGRNIIINTLDDGFNIEIDNDYRINTYRVMEYKGIDDIDITMDPWDISMPFGKNSGVAIDIGVRGPITDRLQVYASVNDMGSIGWEASTSYSSEEKLSYQGIDLLDYLSEDGNVDIADSLYNLLQLQETFNEGLTTGIPMTLKLGLQGKLGSRHEIGGEFQIFRHNQLSLNSLTTYWLYDLSSGWSGRLSYRAIGNSFNNIGAALMKRTGLFRWHFSINNIFGLIRPLDVKYGAFNIGGSLFFD
jgi:hypothetical protein